MTIPAGKSETPTPRTDAAIIHCFAGETMHEWVGVPFARTLERELAATTPKVWTAETIGEAPDIPGHTFLKRDFGVWRIIGDKAVALRYNTGTTDTYYGPIPPVPQPPEGSQ